MNEKHFDRWIGLKEKIHFSYSKPWISEGEIWWCAMGENVGVEINGKNSRFSRPVLVMKKLNGESFMGVPLTSQRKTGIWYSKFNSLGKEEYAALCQARVMSVSRLYSKMGEITQVDLRKIKKDFCALYQA